MTQTIAVLLVDDNPEFLAAAASCLARYKRLQVVGSALSGQEAIEKTAVLRPDLILMDVAMPGMNGLEATRRIKNEDNAPRVVVLTLYDNPEYQAAATEAKADGFVNKAEMDARLVPLIRRLFEEEVTDMKHILVVDDSRTMRRMILASLQRLEGAVFREAASGLEAIEQLALAATDLMLLDLNMPDMHGLEVLRFLQSHQAYRNLPVIVLTTKGDPGSRSAALVAGAAFFITKPFNPDALATLAGRILTGNGNDHGNDRTA